MAESAVSLHSANPAKQLVQQDVPEGVLLSPAWKRVAAYFLDVIFIMGLPGESFFYNTLINVNTVTYILISMPWMNIDQYTTNIKKYSLYHITNQKDPPEQTKDKD